MIKTFADTRTAALFAGHIVRRIATDLQRRAHLKLIQIDATQTLADLRIPPGNRLEALRGNRMGQHSIRVNQQWRICFVWREGNAYDVEFCDYH